MDSGIAGKSVLVTGGSRGIGRAIVELFAAEGADVTFLYRGSTEAAAGVAEAARAAGQRVTAEQADVCDARGVRRGGGTDHRALRAHRRAGQQRRGHP